MGETLFIQRGCSLQDVFTFRNNRSSAKPNRNTVGNTYK